MRQIPHLIQRRADARTPTGAISIRPSLMTTVQRLMGAGQDADGNGMASQIQAGTLRRSEHGRMGALELALVTLLCIFVANIWRPTMFYWFWSGALAVASVPIVVFTLCGQRRSRVLAIAFMPPFLAGVVVNLAWKSPFAILVPPAVLWITCLVTALSSPYRWRRLVANQGRCGVCGYDLTGNVSGRCPECAQTVGPVAVGRPWRTVLLSLLLWVVGAAIGLGLFGCFVYWITSQPI